MVSWSEKDERYATAFGCWRAAEFGDDTDLRHCLRAAALSQDAAEDRLRELRDIGFSGEIPHRFWLSLDDRAVIDGATFDETETFHHRVRRGKPVRTLLKQRRKRMRRPAIALRRAFASLAQAQQLHAAPLVASLTTSDGEIVMLGARPPSPVKG